MKKHGGLIPIINWESFTITQMCLCTHTAVSGPRHGRSGDGRDSRDLDVGV